MKQAFVVSIAILAGLFFSTSALAQTYYPFPDTGQTKCYNNTAEIPCDSVGPGDPFYGQDARYQPRLPRSYTKLGHDDTVLSDNALHVDEGGPWMMTRDNVTGLIWELKTNANKDDTYNWQNAQDVFIAGLNSANYCGFSNWRLPNIKELSSLVNAAGPLWIDAAWFPKNVSSYYRSSTTNTGNTSHAWYVPFYSGDVNNSGKSDNYYVRAVRAGQSESFGDSIIHDNGDGTVTDTTTGLMWQKCSFGQTWTGGQCTGSATPRTWQQAMEAAESLTWANQDDWRLPNRNELQSLVDYSLFSPSIAPVFADYTEHYWSSTTNAHFPDYAWLVYFFSGDVSVSGKPASHYVRAVRAGHSTVGSFVSLAVNSTGASGVSITSDPTDYADTTNYTKTNIPDGTSITLTAPATSETSIFASWTGCDTSDPSARTCTVTMDEDKTVTASYTPFTRVIRLSGDLSFGNVPVNQSTQRTLTIHNDGNSPLSVGSISLPDGFSDNWSGGTIDTGSSRVLTVTFHPAAALEYSGTITVESDATSGTDVMVCSGVGVVLDTYTVTYVSLDHNSGSPPVDNNHYTEGALVLVLGNTGILTKEGQAFAGWNTESDGSGLSRSPGTSFAMPPANLTLFSQWSSAATSASCTLDVDQDGRVNALTDGLLIMRYLAGNRGEDLTRDALGQNARRTNANDIVAFLDSPACQTMLDVDGDGVLSQETDGVLVTRHMFGYSGDALVQDALGQEAWRWHTDQVRSWLTTHDRPASHIRLLPPTVSTPLLSGIAASLRPSVEYTGARMLSYQLLDGPAGMEIDERSGTIVWVPGPELEGQTVSVRISAADGETTAELTFTVSVARTVPVQTTQSQLEDGRTQITVTEDKGNLQGLEVLLPQQITGPEGRSMSTSSLQTRTGGAAVSIIDPSEVDTESIPDDVIRLTNFFRIEPVAAEGEDWIEIVFPELELPEGRYAHELILFVYGNTTGKLDSIWIPVVHDIKRIDYQRTSILVERIGSECFIGLYDMDSYLYDVDTFDNFPDSSIINKSNELLQITAGMKCEKDTSWGQKIEYIDICSGKIDHNDGSSDNYIFKIINLYTYDGYFFPKWVNITPQEISNIMIDAIKKFKIFGLEYDKKMDIYIHTMDCNTSGYLNTDDSKTIHLNHYKFCDNEPKRELKNIKSTIVHEYFHNAQYKTGSIINYSVNSDKIMWASEGTAVWFEDEVYDTDNDYLNRKIFQSNGQFSAPRILDAYKTNGLPSIHNNDNLSRGHNAYFRFPFFKLLHKADGENYGCTFGKTFLPQFFKWYTPLSDGTQRLLNTINDHTCDFGEAFGQGNKGNIGTALEYFTYATVIKNDRILIDNNEPEGLLFDNDGLISQVVRTPITATTMTRLFLPRLTSTVFRINDKGISSFCPRYVGIQSTDGPFKGTIRKRNGDFVNSFVSEIVEGVNNVEWSIPSEGSIDEWYLTLVNDDPKDERFVEFGIFAKSMLRGSLTVNIVPQTVSSNARWRRTGTTKWFKSGEIEDDITLGEHSVEFESVDGWHAPTNRKVTIRNCEINTISVTYSEAPSLAISPSSWNHTSSSYTNQAISVTSNNLHSASSNATWITITGISTGGGNNTVTYSITANSGQPRSGKITLNGGGSSLDFTVNQAAANTLFISGRVTGYPNATITFSNNGGQATTNAFGDYSKSVPYNWTGTATPQEIKGSWSPPSRSYSSVTNNLSDQDFTASRLMTISGRVTDKTTNSGIHGVTIELSNNGGNASTNNNGHYSIDVPYLYTGKAVPNRHEGGNFDPPFKNITEIKEDWSNQNFSWEPGGQTITGRVTHSVTGQPVQGVSVTFSNDGGTAVTGQDGYYSWVVTHDWDDKLTPSHPDRGTFNPEQGGKNNTDFTWVLNPVISGRVTIKQDGTGVDGVTITFEGQGQTTTYNSGYYRFTVPYGWSGEATASHVSGTFENAVLTHTNVTANKTGQDYVWPPPDHVIAGRVEMDNSTGGVPGVQIVFSDNAGETYTNSEGEYSHAVPYSWNGIMTPTHPSGGSFDPETGNKSNVDFYWTPPKPLISGQVTNKLTGTGVDGVSITFEKLDSVVTANGGFYSFAVPYNWSGKVTASFSSGFFENAVLELVKITMNKSDQDYVWIPPELKVEMPTFNPDGGAYPGHNIHVTIQTIPGATIRYTTNSSDDVDENSWLYTEPVTVSFPGVLKARAYMSDMHPSDLKTASYSRAERVPEPSFSPDGGNHPGDSVSVTISAVQDAIIRYTTNPNENVNEGSMLYTGPVTVSLPGTLKARAYKNDMNPSFEKTASYSRAEKLPVPSFSPDSGSYPGSSLNVTMSSVYGATIRYTLNPAEEVTESSNLYTESVTLNLPGTLKARAYKSGFTPSDLKTAEYTVAENYITTSPEIREHSIIDYTGQTISIYSNISWTATTSATWITISDGSAGSGNYTVIYSVDPNTGEARSGKIAISGGDINREFTVNQAGKDEQYKRLNDTGVQFCGGTSSGNNNPCIGEEPWGQDAHHGRDAKELAGTLNKVGDGEAGFDFTKISNSGHALPATAQPGNGPSDWACTRDNVTGLMWEVKVDDSTNFRHKDHTYSWYFIQSPDGNAGAPGDTTTCGGTLGSLHCNTENYANKVNSVNLCGEMSWRVPTVKELETIVHYGRNYAIETNYFPNNPSPVSSRFWTSTQTADASELAWTLVLGGWQNGQTGSRFRTEKLNLRLVSRGLPSEHATQNNVCVNNLPPINPDEVYFVKSDGTIIDTRNGLMWKRCVEGQEWIGGLCSGLYNKYTWKDSFLAAYSSRYGGHEDWRLPNVKELRSLVEECTYYPSINTRIFPFSLQQLDLVSRFWSASPSINNANNSWTVDFLFGSSTSMSRNSLYYLILVRDI
ncbi:DUF1566 domain-containing protein [Desulfonatronum sp. SC1]|uniref:Lcl domain-containing protein n=1 Tax=Desulfonatronum sp. SC1 TaxID=2109626 RepID=UPI000D317810|nr:DUF1566 domain-containing protein [Desulfonatronum sp. SC1]PTN35132.1 hypothetical protein C6366_11470 [Desulfonatronum sp. SC1]